MRGHSEKRARAQACPVFRFNSAGNTAAHVRAQEAASWHPCPANLGTSLLRTAHFSGKVLGWYARLLEWSISRDLLPKVSPLHSLFGKLRPLTLPAHCVAMSMDGVARCVRCLLPEGMLHKRSCRPDGSRSHTLWALSRGPILSHRFATLAGLVEAVLPMRPPGGACTACGGVGTRCPGAYLEIHSLWISHSIASTSSWGRTRWGFRFLCSFLCFCFWGGAYAFGMIQPSLSGLVLCRGKKS